MRQVFRIAILSFFAFSNMALAQAADSVSWLSGSVIYLSDLAPVRSVNGWGPYEKDRSNGEAAAGDGNAIKIRGTAFAKGLGVHADSNLAYQLGGTCRLFKTTIGLDDEVHGSGSVVFRVTGDGKELYRSPLLKGGNPPVPLELDISGVKELGLVVDRADNFTLDHADWADAQVNCDQTQEIYASDLKQEAVQNGWGPLERDKSNGELLAGDGKPLTLAGKRYAKGLGVHADSSVTYKLNKLCSRFSADIGLDDEVGNAGRVTFRIVADGTEIFHSTALTGSSATVPVSVNLQNVTNLTLLVDSMGDKSGDHADWADAKFTCRSSASSASPNPSSPPQASPEAPLVPGVIVASGPTSYSLQTDGTVSIGVFNSSGVLVRTLVSGEKQAAGQHALYWDGKDDFGQPVDVAGNYQFRVLFNNVRYGWEGVIGNSSFDAGTPYEHQHRAFGRISGMAITGDKAYFGTGFAEGASSHSVFSLSNPQSRTGLFPEGKPGQMVKHVATDGDRVYWAGNSGFSPRDQLVIATDAATGKLVTFDAGKPMQMNYSDLVYPSVIDITNGAQNKITGLAVQKSGGYLFTSRTGSNEVHVIDKRTGALVRTVTINKPGALAIDGSDRLWIVSGTSLQPYNVDSSGSLSPVGSPLPGLRAPMAMAVSPDRSTILVADGEDSQQIKAYSLATGEQLWVFGQAGGYRLNPNVTNDRFYFSDLSGRINDTFLAFSPDGSFWVGDSGNYRVQHFTANRTFIDRISYIQNSYSMAVDQADARRVFDQFLEFAIDYSKPGLKDRWTLARNWGAKVPEQFFNIQDVEHNVFVRGQLQGVVTLSNGRTYALSQRETDGARWEMVELAADGLRQTGILFLSETSPRLDKDGSLHTQYNGWSEGAYGIVHYNRRPLTGFDALGNPTWGDEKEYARVPLTSARTEPVGWTGTREAGLTTSTGVMVTFDHDGLTSQTGHGYHLGGIKPGVDGHQWKSALATFKSYQGEYPKDGGYDIGNGVVYGGGGVTVAGRHIFWNYHGEFWKDSQTNKWQHLNDDGLLLGVFGITGPEARAKGNQDGMAGNALYGQAVKIGNEIYIWHAEESGHGGLNLWKVYGLDTINEAVIPFRYDNAPTGSPGATEGADLLAGQPINASAVTNAIFSRDSGPNIANEWAVRTNVLTATRSGSPDVQIKHTPYSDASRSVTWGLGHNVSRSQWKLSAVIDLKDSFPNEGESPESPNSSGMYVDVLDDKGRVIARFQNQIHVASTYNVKILGNHAVIQEGPLFEKVAYETSGAQPFSIERSGDTIIFMYAGYGAVATAILEPTASIGNPTSLRVSFWRNGLQRDKAIDFLKLRFRP